MAFKFTSNKIDVNIGGKGYSICADAAFYDGLVDLQKQIASITAEQLAQDEHGNVTLSGYLRDMIGVFIGKDAQDAIFANRTNDVLSELELLAFLFDSLASVESGAIDKLDTMLKKIGLGSNAAIETYLKQALIFAGATSAETETTNNIADAVNSLTEKLTN